MNDQPKPLPVRPSRHHIRHIMRRTLSKSWDDSIFSESAQAAFWCALSLPPLLLGMLGSLAYIAPLFGPETLTTIEHQIIGTANSFFSRNVVNEIIAPTIRDIVKGARGEVVSLGFVISLWAGSSAISAFVDSIVEAHDQTPLRHPVRQRFYALGLYVIMLVFVIASAPLVAVGPLKIGELLRRTQRRRSGGVAGARHARTPPEMVAGREGRVPQRRDILETGAGGRRHRRPYFLSFS
jgi:membrane protein